jgi:NADPH:quinone reductase-like Zn-dependent oxidoreductase
VPVSDGAGVVTAVAPGVTEWKVGDRVMSHFVAGWQDGPFCREYIATTLGSPGPGLATEEVVLPANALLAMPRGLDFAPAATLPIAALTAWSALVTEGSVSSGQTVLTLGTGGVSIFALQIAKALGARVILTSSSDEKLARGRALGADAGVNYAVRPDWDKEVLELTSGTGADLVVENGGIGTLGRSLKAVRPGGTIALLGALTGLKGEVDIGPILMKRVKVAGIMVDCRAAFADMVCFVEKHQIEPVIDARFSFDELDSALRHMQAGKHFGKIVVEIRS